MTFIDIIDPRRNGRYHQLPSSSIDSTRDCNDYIVKFSDQHIDKSNVAEDIIFADYDHTIRAYKKTRRLFYVNAILFMSSIAFYALVVLGYLSSEHTYGRNYLLRETSEPSPLFDAIDIPMKTVRLNGTFIEMDPPSIFRQPPSPEVDAAWDRIETQAPIPITRQDVINQGRDPDDAVKFPESFGFGPDAFVGRIDVFHQIHCLNRIRKHLHWNIDYYYGDETMSKYHMYHVSHCIYTLLQNLQCTGNVDVYSHFWADAQENAYPDFSLNHKCRDFEAILAYHDEHAVPLEKFGAIRKPEGQKSRIMSHAFKEAFEWYDEKHPDIGEIGTAVG